MLTIKPITPAIGAVLSGFELSESMPAEVLDEIYRALIKHLVIVVRNADISPQAHLAFAQSFGEIDEPHPCYPHVDGFENIVRFEHDASTPPDTNSWHTDLTFKMEQPFASILVARDVPPAGGDTLWSSCYAAYDRLPPGMRCDLEDLQAIHDFGDFRNFYCESEGKKSGPDRLNESAKLFGHNVRPLIGTHPVTGRKFLNYNEAFVAHIAGKTTGESNALKALLANHMNRPEDQMRWRWAPNDLVMWDNRVTMHYAVADYLPNRRCMHRITVVRDRRCSETAVGGAPAAQAARA